MTQQSRHHSLQTLQEIRSLMERSSRFISLSGLSGVAAGVFALMGATAVYIYLDFAPFHQGKLYYVAAKAADKWGIDYITFFLAVAAIVCLLAISCGIFFTTRKARSKGQKIWGPLTLRLLLSLGLPLVTGGLFCMALIYHGFAAVVAPATLVFYGLGLLNASKYTLPEIRYLGFSEIILGLIAVFKIGYGLEFWAIGFGIFHIIYGTIMYFWYERRTA